MACCSYCDNAFINSSVADGLSNSVRSNCGVIVLGDTDSAVLYNRVLLNPLIIDFVPTFGLVTGSRINPLVTLLRHQHNFRARGRRSRGNSGCGVDDNLKFFQIGRVERRCYQMLTVKCRVEPGNDDRRADLVVVIGGRKNSGRLELQRVRRDCPSRRGVLRHSVTENALRSLNCSVLCLSKCSIQLSTNVSF